MPDAAAARAYSSQQQQQPQAQPLNLNRLSPLENRAVGSLLGCMAGDVLGAGVEGWDAADIAARFPRGFSEFLDTQRG